MRVLRGLLLVGLLGVLTASAALAQEAPDEQVDGPSTGLVGRVVLVTRCPVTLGDVDQGGCPMPGVQSTVTVRSADGSTPIAQVDTDDAGAFSIPLDPGAYLVEVPSAFGGVVRAQTQAVTVAPDAPTPLLIRVTGLLRRQP